MTFLIFELLFAATAIGMLVVLVLIARQLWQGRQPSAAKPIAEPRPKLRVQKLHRLVKRQAEPEPASEAPSARRRQLRTLSEIERSETVEPPPVEAKVVEAAEPIVEPQEDFSQAVLARLEAGFERLQAGEITIETYEAQVRTENDAVDERIVTLGTDGDPAALAAAQEARESVHWCLDWASERRAHQQPS